MGITKEIHVYNSPKIQAFPLQNIVFPPFLLGLQLVVFKAGKAQSHCKGKNAFDWRVLGSVMKRLVSKEAENENIERGFLHSRITLGS